MTIFRYPYKFILWICVSLLPALTTAQSTLTEDENDLAIEWLDEISKDDDTDILTRALISQHYRPEAPQNFLLKSNATPDEVKVGLSILIDQCSKFPEISYCYESELEKRLIRADPDNLTPYLFLFSYFSRESQMDAALQALVDGLSTAGNNDYYFEKVMHLRDRLQFLGFKENRTNLAAEIYSLNSLLSIYTNINPVCVRQSATSENWKSVCLDLSSRLEEGMTLFSNIYGASIRRDVLNALSPNSDEAKLAQSQRDYYDQFRIEARALLEWWDDLEKRPDSFYTDASRIGEFQADQLAMERSRNAERR